MFKSGPNYEKLKTNLRLVVNRLKLLEKKRTEMALKSRKEIADYISLGKEDRARIRVEHIIREDYTVEAMEIIEMYADLLLARFGLIQTQKEIDPGLSEAVDSLLWAAPRLEAEVAEIKTVSEQLTSKYGKERTEAARANREANTGGSVIAPSTVSSFAVPISVNEKLVHKMSVRAPADVLVEQYMIEIASSYSVPFTPNPEVMNRDELWLAERMLQDMDQGAVAAPIQPGAAHPPDTALYPPQYPPQYPPPPKAYPQDGPLPSKEAPDQAGALPPKAPLNGDALDLPSAPAHPPTGGPNQGGGGDIDFDDLTKRFEELKKRK